MEYDYIVIGAGAAGLSFAALMEKRGFKVALLESHSLPGGCASYYERNGNIFDVGATTLSGLKEGRSLDLLIKELDLKLTIKKIDPGIIAVFKDKSISRYSDHREWLKELENKFPNIYHKAFWNLVRDIDEEGWKLSANLKNVPLRSINDLLDFKISSVYEALKILPYFLRSTSSYLDSNLENNYKSLINEILFITAQNNLSDTPMLMGSMGLNYPADTGYAMGGMKVFTEAIAAKCSHVFYRHQVTAVKALDKGHKGFTVQTTKGDFNAKQVISTLPIWNHDKLFAEDENMKKFFTKGNYNQTLDDCWSAFMLYLTVPLDASRKSLYYQIHCDTIPNCHTNSFFVSLSHPEDKSRTESLDRQVVTISTHTKPKFWLELSKDEYKLKKQETANFILAELTRSFSLEISDLQNVQTGSPTTFIKYTKRHNGLVGGIPHSIRRNILKTAINASPVKNFYFIGDTQFPGQGIGAVVLGAQNLVHHLTK